MSMEAEKPHIVSNFSAELDKLSGRIITMGELAGRQIDAALEAIRTADEKLAAQVVANDALVDQAHVEIGEMAVRILVLRQPMALDLRQALTAIRAASVVERIGDLSRNIARRLPGFLAGEGLPMTAAVLKIGHAARELVAAALVAYQKQDPEMAADVRNRDALIDSAYNELFEEIVAYMENHPAAVRSGTLMLAMAQNLERIGDYATSLANLAYFIAEGTYFDEGRVRGDRWGVSGQEGS